MKKALCILGLLSALCCFISCDDNKKDDTVYLDNKLVEGVWSCTIPYDSLVYTFKDNKLTTEFWAYVAVDGGVRELKFETKEDLGNYLLTDTRIILPMRSELEWPYKFAEDRTDSLYIRDGKDYWHGFEKLKE